MSNISIRNLWPLAVMGLLAACSNGGSEPAEPARPEAEHFNLADLQALGCSVAVTPKRNMQKIVLVGQIDGYGFVSTTPCATQLISLLQPTNKFEDGMWQGVRSAASTFASKQGYTQQRYAGQIGEYSEIEVFSHNGDPVGFEYSVQSKDTLHSVIVISDRIVPDEAFEALLQRKL